MKRLFLIACILMGMLQSANAELAIILHPSNNTTLSDAQIKNIYLGKLKTFSDGSKAIAISMQNKDPGFALFLENVIGKTKNQWKEYWARIIFTGRGTPPKTVEVEAIVELVAKNPSIIAFTTETNLPDNVRVLKTY